MNCSTGRLLSVIDPPPKDPTLSQAIEWMMNALREEGFEVLMCGRSALDYQGEYTGSIDADILIGADFRGASSLLDAYVSRGDLVLVGGTQSSVARYMVRGEKPVDVIDVSSVHSKLFNMLWRDASAQVDLGTAGKVPAVTREGYFVLAIMIGLKGFAREKADPMMKVREAWAMFGKRTDGARVNAMLEELKARITLEEAATNQAAE